MFDMTITLITSILCMIGAITGFMAIGSYINFDKENVLEFRDKVLGFIIFTSTAGSFSLAVLLFEWAFLYNPDALSRAHNLAFNMAHSIGSISTIYFHVSSVEKIESRR